MTDRKYPPLAHKLGRVVRGPEVEENDRGKRVKFAISVPLSYEPNDSDWVTVTAYDGKKAYDKALQVEKGDRVVVEGAYKVTEGRSKPFHDITAFAIYRATEIVAEDDDL